MFRKRHFIFAGILAVLIVLPLISYLVVKSGAEIRKNIRPSNIYDTVGIALPAYYCISQRGDTIDSERMQGKVIVLELFSASCSHSGILKHPLFELQEDYNNKTLKLRFVSVITDSVYGQGDLEKYANRYAARDQWHVVYETPEAHNALVQAFNRYLEKKDVKNLNHSCPENVLLIDKRGIIRGCYDIFDKREFSDLYNDILYLIDVNYESQ